ncbi:MAG: hypothetical protein II649_05040, partial [Kiritimatiellae bacterium]|nr:hypothetical protein [Kiritimatiellia bacterium]
AVNGTDVTALSGEGWTLDTGTMAVRLSGAGPFELSGDGDGIGVSADNSCEVVLSGTTLDTNIGGMAALAIADGKTVRVVLSGENRLSGGSDNAGLEVPESASLVIGGGGKLVAKGGDGGAGIGGGRYGSSGAITVETGVVEAQGGFRGAGIGGGEGEESGGGTGTVTIDGGRVTATGGYLGAGIGGGYLGMGKVTISGGDVTATGGRGGSGVGSGSGSISQAISAGWVRITGGIVAAQGGEYGFGIGGGQYTKDVSVEISGGTVSASGGDVKAIGCARSGNPSGTVLFTGGSIAVASGDVAPAASNATERVWRVTMDGFAPGAKVSVTRDGYGTSGIYADGDGKVHLWLPDGRHAFVIGGRPMLATVSDADTAASLLPMSGVSVNGTDIAFVSGDGWSYDYEGTLTLSGPGPFTLSGSTNSLGVKATADCDVTLDGFSTAAKGAAFKVTAGASAVITLSGANTLASGSNSAGLQVEGGAAVTLRGTGSLSATGGSWGAGIGGGACGSVGAIAIEGGEITAQGGASSAGIGGGYEGSGGTITISGGTVTATGVYYGAGIGGGYGGAGGTIAISGGMVTATGGSGWGKGGAGIGGGYGGAGGTIAISGGTVTATGGTDSAGIGGGKTGESGVILISGGIVRAASGGGADIGDGDNPSRYGNTISVSITGGTVFPAHGASGYAIGHASGGASYPPKVTISGGSVAAVAATVNPAPANSDNAAVFRVEVDVGAANRKVQFAGLENYGTDDIWSDENGKVYLWLPAGSETPVPALRSALAKSRTDAAGDGAYRFNANGHGVTATVDAAGTVEVVSEPLKADGFTINSFQLEGDAAVLNVSAAPETWMAGFFDKVKIRASAMLPIPDDDSSLVPLSGMTVTPNADGTATVVVPLGPAAGRFYRVESAGD